MRRVLVGVAVGASLALSGCALVGGGGTYHVTAFFPRAVSLYETSEVRVLGLPAGEVTEIVVEDDRVRVELEVSDDVPIPVDVKAALIPQSLIGERYVQLMPAWREGEPRMQDAPEEARIIDVDETIVPVEPDEALAAVNEFLQELNPDDLRRLVDNAADSLEGNGEDLGTALETVSGLVDSFARRDEELAAIVDNFDDFTATLVTREAQLGQVIDSFARTAAVLAEERQSLEALLDGLARVSVDGFDLVAEHAAELRTDVDVIGRLGRSLVANLDGLTQFLNAGPDIADGINRAYNPMVRAMNLRSQFGPLAQQGIEPILQSLLGDDFRLPCVPVDTACAPSGGGIGGRDSTAAVEAELPVGRTPVDDVLDFLAAPSHPAGLPSAPSFADRVAGGVHAFGGFLRRAAGTLTGAGE